MCSFPNFSLISEDRESHALELYLTAYFEDPTNVNNANCYKYTLGIEVNGIQRRNFGLRSQISDLKSQI